MNSNWTRGPVRGTGLGHTPSNITASQIMRMNANRSAFIAKKQALARGSQLTMLRGVQPNNYLMARPGARPAPEIKSFDCAIVGGQLAITPLSAEPGVAFAGITCINEVQQGAAFYNRIGTKITVKSIAVNLNFYTAENFIATGLCNIRCMVVYDRQTNGAYPVISDILSVNDSGYTAAFGQSTGINMSNRARFLVLRDKRWNLDAAQGYNFSLNEFIKGRWDCEYGTTATNIGEIKSGAIYVIAFTDVLAPYIQEPVARIRYFD
nr:MAG: capsid protein [Cressdnaviricota sp.]